jgi:hypothetical protein
MSIIVQTRENIINNSNTAQENLLGILNRTNKRTIDLEINESLSGNIDFSVLHTEGFSSVKNIRFLKRGNITSINNLPNELEVLHCPSQLLINLNNLPESLIELNTENNHIDNLDVSKLPNLKILNISNNRFTEIDNIRPSIEELYCNDNNIKVLNLHELFKLRILHVSNNRSIIVKNLPPSVIDFKSENNPFVEVNHENMYDESETKRKTSDDYAQEKLNYIEALNNYFKLKVKYENTSYKNKEKIYKKVISKKEKKKLLSSYTNTCINCKKLGGTIFSKKDNTYFAYCGNKANPCNLKIEIYAGKYCSNHFAISTERERINNITSKIIQEKLNTIFGYESDKDAVSKFKKQIEEFTFYNNDYKDCLERNTNLYRDEIKDELIKRKHSHIYDIINAIKDLIEEYEKTNNGDLLKLAVELQVKELNPEIHNLQLLKYEIMEMITDSNGISSNKSQEPSDESSENKGKNKESNTYYLYQRYASLFKSEYNIGKPPKVIHYNSKK